MDRYLIVAGWSFFSSSRISSFWSFLLDYDHFKKADAGTSHTSKRQDRRQKCAVPLLFFCPLPPRHWAMPGCLHWIRLAGRCALLHGASLWDSEDREPLLPLTLSDWWPWGKAHLILRPWLPSVVKWGHCCLIPMWKLWMKRCCKSYQSTTSPQGDRW